MTNPARSPLERHRRAPSQAGARGGFTLLELLLVMGLIGIITGVGLGLFAGFDPGRRAAVGLVQNVLRSAQQSAVARRAPALVHFDRATGTLIAEALEVAGTWHFESMDLPGARGLDGLAFDFPGEVLAEDGYTGQALDFGRGGRRPRVEVDVSVDSLLNPRRGFQLDVALRPAANMSARVVDLGGAVQLSVRGDGGVDARILTERIDELGRSVVGPPVTLRSAPGVLRLGRWTRVSLVYDRRELVLSADGVPLAATGEERALWALVGPLVLGDATQRWPGAMDQLVLSTVTASEEYTLPSTVTFDERTPTLVRFLAGGSLDPALHAGPVVFGLVFEGGGGDEVRINPFGPVE